MASSKLSDADKQVILDLYRQPAETTSTLAERYGVSSSTISRVLKQKLPADEYSQLIQQKRSGVSATPVPTATVVEAEAAKESPTPVPVADVPAATTEAQDVPDAKDASDDQPEKPSKPAAPIRRKRSRSTAAPKQEEVQDKPLAPVLVSSSQPKDEPISSAEASIDTSEDDADAVATVTAWDEEDEPLTDDDYGDDDDLEDEDDDDDWDEGERSQTSPRQEQLEVLPFEQATFQRTCYLVVDRLAELITCPLRDFSDLGDIPKEEEQARTLPVFDNHRVARRFSRRNQRVIKIPDASILQKTQSYLQAKGITRLLINGQVYAISLGLTQS